MVLSQQPYPTQPISDRSEQYKCIVSALNGDRHYFGIPCLPLILLRVFAPLREPLLPSNSSFLRFPEKSDMV